MTTSTQNNRLAVTILRSTPKANLIADAANPARQGWIQRRWLAADGTVAAATLDKAIAHAEQRKAQAAAARDWRGDLHLVRAIARETDKAIAVEVVVESSDGEQAVTRLAWLPKSQCAVNVDGRWAAPGWLIAAREEEIIANLGRGCHFEIGICG